MNPLLVVGPLVILLVLVLLSILVARIIYQAHKIKTMNKDIENLLDKIVKINSDEYNYIKSDVSKKLPYDYIFETKDNRYYIKVLKNFGNYEICVNNSTKWQIKKSINDAGLNFIYDNEELMRLDFEDENDNSSKFHRKIFIIYPNAKSLLKNINECEMGFIHYNTDVYGANIITYANLIIDPSLMLKIYEN